tara:strand:+ start:5979 stop:7361 length:1383 start_codon:yes stop_codon:yes gene_type:complete
MKKNKILMVEDTVSIAALYKSYLSPLDLNVNIVGTGKEALKFIKDCTPDLILLDLKLPDMTGMEILGYIKKENINIPVIIMTAHGTMDLAIEAIRFGAQDFLIKPCEADRLRITVSKSLKDKSTLNDNIKTKKIEGAQYQGFIGNSLPMQEVYRIIEAASSSKATVFITGESGTGKEVCAEAVHAASDRNDKPFIAINCAAIPKELIESELFGHVKGAFTGAISDRKGAVEMADKGTLMLDELCEMDLDLQSKLLRFIQTGTYQKVGSSKTYSVDVRFICATNCDPLQEVKKGRFREDLYYRLYVIPIFLPPLRNRERDIIDIAHAILGLTALEEGKKMSRFSDSVIELFQSYSWPGNVRELQNVIRNIVVLNSGEEVTFDMIPFSIKDKKEHKEKTEQENILTTEIDYTIKPLWIYEKIIVEKVIKHCNGSIPLAAKHLEISPSTIYRKIENWNKKKNE